MSIKNINPADWFYFEDDADEEFRDSNKDSIKIYNDLKNVAHQALKSITSHPNKAENVLKSLDIFYKSCQKLGESANDTEIRDSINHFIREVIKESETNLDIQEAFTDIQLGHVGIQFRPESILYSFVTPQDVKDSVNWLIHCLKSKMITEIPGLMTINVRKNKPRADDEYTPALSISYSLNINDLNNDHLSDEPLSSELLNPTSSELKSLKSFANGILQVLRKDKSPFVIERLGIIQATDLPGYNGKNPATGELIPIPGRRIISFRMNKELKKILS